MQPVSRISRWFAFAGVIAAAGLIGWVARSTSAHKFTPRAQIQIPQSAPREKTALIPDLPAHEMIELAQAPAEPLTIPSEPVPTNLPTQTTKADVLDPVPTQVGPELSKTIGLQDPQAPDSKPQPLPEAPDAPTPSAVPATTISSNPSIAADNEDPEKAVQSFVDQNQKVAETRLKSLRDEEAKLRARLKKVEAGIKRWEALVGALKMSKDVSTTAVTPSVVFPAADTPFDLVPIPRSSIVGPRVETQKK